MFRECPECGSDSIYAEATVYWQPFGEYWELSNPFDPTEATCMDCDTTFDLVKDTEQVTS